MRSILTLSLAFLLATFEASGTGNTPVPLRELRNAPITLAVQDRSLSLSATLWRDFMPSMPPSRDGKPLIAIFKVATAGGKSFPAGVRVDRAWVFFGEQLWEPSQLEEQDAAEPSYRNKSGAYANRAESPVFNLVARGGPKWRPGVEVDVVVQLIDKDGQHYLLRTAKQGIGKVN